MSQSLFSTLDLPSQQLGDTVRIGRALGALLFPGAVVALMGPLGAGKTALTRGIAEGLGVTSPEQVTSPTFMLIQEYAARLPIYHFDAYRLAKVSEFEDLGALEYFAGDGVCVVEWADRVASLLPREHLRIEVELTNSQSRVLHFTGHGQRYQQIVDQLAASFLS